MSLVSTAGRLTVEHVTWRPPLPARWLAPLRVALKRRVFLSAAREVAAVLQTGDRAKLLAAAPGWRDRARRFGAPTAAMMNQALDGVRIAEDAGLAVPARMIESDAFTDEGLIVYVPGGSFVVGLSPRLTALVARIARAAATKTCIVEYRLAPEHPCPAAVEDVERAVEELLARGAGGRRIVVLAESAGAAIALAAVCRLRDRGVELAGLCLLSPWTDLALTGLSLVTRSLSATTGTRMEFPAICAHLYLQGLSPFDPVASPVYGDLDRLPPMLVQTSRGDAFHDDARSLADRAYRAGTDVTLRVWPGSEHVCEQAFDGQSTRAIEAAAAFIRARLW